MVSVVLGVLGVRLWVFLGSVDCVERGVFVMRVLAIDPGTNCGFAHSCGLSGTWDLSVRRDESSGMRLIRLRGKLNEIKASCGVDLLVFESARNGKFANAVKVAGAIQGAMEVWAIDCGVEYRGYSPSEIKKFATGKGNCGKGEMVSGAQVKWPGLKIEDDNHADALWLLSLCEGSL